MYEAILTLAFLSIILAPVVFFMLLHHITKREMKKEQLIKFAWILVLSIVPMIIGSAIFFGEILPYKCTQDEKYSLAIISLIIFIMLLVVNFKEDLDE